MKTVKKILTTLIFLIIYSHSIASSTPTPLVNTDWLAKNLDQVFILDVRKSEESFISKPVYEKDDKTGEFNLVKIGGHIPGANFLLYKNVRGEQKIDGTTVKYMLPQKSVFENLMRQIGLNKDNHIVVVTNAENDYDINIAARVYWQIKFFGHDKVSVLDGGTAQWLIDGGDITLTPSKPSTGNWQATEERIELLASIDDVSEAIDNNIQLIDVRPIGQYLGLHKSSKVSDKGHIPSAKSYPIELIANKKIPVKFSSMTELQNISDALSIKTNVKSITYCNSGHMAAGGWFVMFALLGNENVKLYDGSMHQWTAEKRPVVKMKME